MSRDSRPVTARANHLQVAGQLLRVILHGDDAALGRVRASDIATVITGVERAMARGCGHVLGRRVKTTGRWGVLIEEAVDLRLVGFEEGSLVHVFEIPSPIAPPDSLQLGGSSLGDLGAQIALSALGASAVDYPDVAGVWLQVADDVGIGTRYDDLELIQQVGDGERTAILDRGRRQEIEETLRDLPTFELRRDLVVGVLVEADFEAMTARLRTPSGDRVQVSFEPALSDDIQLALRHSASLVGEIRFSTDTATAVSVHVRSITAPQQLDFALAPPRFAQHLSLRELSDRQQPPRFKSADDLPHLDLPPDEARAAIEALES
jgi:hypothetical protein